MTTKAQENYVDHEVRLRRVEEAVAAIEEMRFEIAAIADDVHKQFSSIMLGVGGIMFASVVAVILAFAGLK